MQKSCKSLKYSKWTPKNAKLAQSWFHSVCWANKKIMYKQRRYLNYLSKFKRFPLKTSNLHRRWLNLWRLYMVTISKPSQIFTATLRSQIMAPRQVSTFSDLFYIFNFLETKKSIFELVANNYFAYCPSDFSCIRHPHVEKTINKIFLTIFLQ